MKFKKILIQFLIILSFSYYGMADFSEIQPRTINLKEVSGGIFDIATDKTNTLHLVWSLTGKLWYGQIVNDKIINIEEIPQSGDFQSAFIRPRLYVRPDGDSIHLAWMLPKPGTSLIHVWKNSSGWHREVVWSQRGSKDFVSVPWAVEDMTGKMHILAQLWHLESSGKLFSKIKYWYKEPGKSYNLGYTLIEQDKKWRDTSMFVDYDGGVHGVFKSGSDPGKYVFCESGGTFNEDNIEDIPIPPGNVCVSFGDLFVDRAGNVHHAHMSYASQKIYYNVRNKETKKWGIPLQVSETGVETCVHKNYDNPWPGIALDPDGTAYITWADMPCPDQDANRITLAVVKNGAVAKREILTTQAEIDEDSKPAICGNDNGIYLIWRHWEKGEMMMYTVSKLGFFPPTSCIYELVETRTLFSHDVMNRLTWEANSKNDDVDVVIDKFNIYVRKNGGEKELLDSVNSSTFQYDHKGIDKEADYSYEITSVNSEGEESGSEVFVKKQ